MPRVLVVDDDLSMRIRLVKLLKGINDLTVDTAADQAEAQNLISENNYRLALVDIELGSDPMAKYAGLGMLQDLSNRGCVTLVVSGTAESNLRSVSMSLRAYDFLAKPFDDLEFIHKVRNALSYIDPDKKAFKVGVLPEGLSYDPDTKTGLLWHGHRVRLTLTELSVVGCLIASPGEVLIYRDLTQAMKSARSEQAVATHISNIRRKFRDVDENFDRIHTEPAKGYYWKPKG